MASDPSPLLMISDLSVNYGALRVLRNVSINVRRGEVVSILGPNGHGKSTLMRAISGLVRNQSGEIGFRGQSMEGFTADRRRGLGIGHVPQGDLLFTDLTVEENMLAGTYMVWGRRTERMREVFDLFPELAARKRSLAGNLSGGERRMLAIARAIMAPADLLLVDEPSIGLAPSAIARVYRTLSELVQNGGTILLVEETLERVKNLSDRVYLLDHGQIVAEATPAILSADAQLRKTYLGLA